MLILLATWIAYNWWKLLIGVVAIIIIIEYRYYRKKDPGNAESGGQEPDREEAGDG